MSHPPHRRYEEPLKHSAERQLEAKCAINEAKVRAAIEAAIAAAPPLNAEARERLAELLLGAK